MRLAIVTTHPIQYYAPWFRDLAAKSDLELKVFYLWNPGAEAKHDPGFGRTVQWDVPLLEGYDFEFLQNTARRPGSDRFWGIRNADLGRRLAEFRPDVALLIGYRYASMMRLILTPARWRGYPLLFRGDSHRLGENRKSEVGSRKWRSAIRDPRSAIRRRAIAAIYARFAAFLYVGQANRDYFRMHGVPEEKLFFAPHAIDNERFIGSADSAAEQGEVWRRELGIGDDQLVVLFAGKFEEKKRPLDLLEAFRQTQLRSRKEEGESSDAEILRSEFGSRNSEPAIRNPQSAFRIGVSLLFVGNGRLEEELRRRAADVPNVFFAPFQNQSLMPRTYAACDLFVLPSYGPEESWGLAVNEALCLAKPVIVSSHVGCGADLVQPRQNGLVFEAGNVAALTGALQEALSDPERLQQWGRRGREIVRNYDYAAATKGLLAALASLRSSDGEVRN